MTALDELGEKDDATGNKLWDLSTWQCRHVPKCLPEVRVVDLTEHNMNMSMEIDEDELVGPFSDLEL